jgi:nucleoside-diphosphate-sugar epimerase
MVIGNGLLARRFEAYKDDDKFLVFASGLSNSKTKDTKAFEREVSMLRENINEHPGKIIVYFSTCSMYDPGEKDSPYVQHKLNIENIIQANAGKYFIFRASHLTGKSSNPNTVLNYFYQHIKQGIKFDLWINACRNIIDIDDAYFIADHVLKNNQPSAQPINIASPLNYPVKDIVSAIESFLGISSIYTEVNKGNCFEIDISATRRILDQLPAKFNDDYLPFLLTKYYT